MKEICELEMSDIWGRSRRRWHYPQIPEPVLGPSSDGEFPFENYGLTIDKSTINEGREYVENLFDHLIAHYVFCPRSLEASGLLALEVTRTLKDLSLARRMVNIFTDIVVDSFRLERSPEDERRVLLGWKRLARQETSEMDRAVIGFLGKYWSADLPRSELPEVDMLLQVFSPGVRDRSLWPRQCGQLARVLQPLAPGILGRGPVRSLEMLSGNAEAIPLTGLATGLSPERYSMVLDLLGIKADLAKWYRDQSYSVEIRPDVSYRESRYPSGPIRWRMTDPPEDLDIAYSMSLSPRLIPGVTTFKRDEESCKMAGLGRRVPDLLVVLDSSKSMDGHALNTKTHKATIAAFKACSFAHSQGADVAAINFSEKYLVQPWTRDLSAVEKVMVEYQCMRTNIPGCEILDLASQKPGCLVLCITDTRIHNLYTEWEYLEEAAERSKFILFCIDEAGKDKYVEGALGRLGRVYYINAIDDLLSLVVETAEGAYAG